jgi:hypothetical protein
MNTHETIEELLDTSFSMLSVSYERKVGGRFFRERFASVVIAIQPEVLHWFV